MGFSNLKTLRYLFKGKRIKFIVLVSLARVYDPIPALHYIRSSRGTLTQILQPSGAPWVCLSLPVHLLSNFSYSSHNRGLISEDILSTSSALSHFVLLAAEWDDYHYNSQHLDEETESQMFEICLEIYNNFPPLDLTF
jgi:hypothetical protein